MFLRKAIEGVQSTLGFVTFACSDILWEQDEQAKLRYIHTMTAQLHWIFSKKTSQEHLSNDEANWNLLQLMTKELPFLKVSLLIMSRSKKWIQIWIAFICGNLCSKIAYFWMHAIDKLLIRSVLSVFKTNTKSLF